MSSTARRPILGPPTIDERPLWNAWLSIFNGPALAVADELGVFPLLDQEPLTPAQAASVLGISERAAIALFALLGSLGFLAQAEGRFHLTDLSRTYLLPKSPYCWSAFLRRYRERAMSSAVLLEAMQRDEPPAGATEVFRSADPARMVAFTEAMHSHSFGGAMRFAVARHAAHVQRLLDIGGGSGAFSIALAQQNPSLRCTVLDLAPVCAKALEYIGRHGVMDRVTVHAADMFEDPLPLDHDVHFFGDILHDWEPSRCARLLERSYAALPDGGQIWIHEMLLADSKDGPHAAAAYAMAMVFSTRGRQYTERELVRMLEHAGFVDAEARALEGYYTLISATK